MRCARCEAELVRGVLGGLCPACLLDAGLPDEEREASGSGSQFHYDLIEEIGRGGMGVVYRAIQHGSQRQVAVKMILAEQAATPGMMDRFRSEVEAVASLDHPNILPVYETGDAEGTPFYSMKFANGGTLRDVASKFRMRSREAAAMMAVIARAVHHAHERGILHRDLKPGNILLDGAANTPYVSDFGLAKWLGRDNRLTIAPSALGTPHYISPEQARGASAELTTATDVYSLGAILYEFLSGRPPFIADTPLETLRLVTDAEPAPPRSFEASVPRDLEVICLKCLAKEPEARYRSAAALAEDLEHWLEGRSITARPSRPPERLLRWAKRNPAFAALAALSLLLLVTFAIGSPIAAARIARSRDRAVTAEKEATEKLYGSYLAQARASRLTGRAGQRLDALAAISQAARIHTSLDLRNEAIAALALFDVHIGRTWKRLPAPYLQLAFDEQLERYACEGENGSVVIRSVADQHEIVRLAGPGGRPEFIYAFSPTGDYVVAKFTNGQTCLWHLPNPNPVLVLQGNRTNGQGWSALSSQLFAFVLPEGGVDIYRLEEIENSPPTVPPRPWRHWPEPAHTQGIAFDPSGTKLALSDVADGDVAPEKRQRVGGVKVREVESGKILWNSPVDAGVGSALWSSDGSLIAASSWDKAVHILDASSGTQLRLLEGHRDGVTLSRFNHRGSRIASLGLDGFMIFWDVRSGEDLVRIPIEDITYLFSPDDGRMGLAVNTDTVGLLEIEDTRVFQAWRPTNSPGRPLGFAVSQDGNFLASTGFTGVEIWDAANSRLALSVPTTEVRVSTVAFLAHKKDELALLIGNDGDGYAEQIVHLDPAANPPRPRLETPTPWLHESGWLLASLSPDGTRVALHRRDGKRPAIIAALDDSSRRVELPGQRRTRKVVFSNNGLLVAGGSSAQDGVAVWKAETGELIRKLEENVDASAAFDPANRWLVTATGSGYRFWSLLDWQPGPHLEMSDLKSAAAAFSPDGRYLAVLEAGGQVGIFDAATAEHLADLEPPFSVAPSFINFSGDGRWLNVLGIDQTIQRWDLLTLREELSRYGLNW
jgi:WD40 repeat protein/predicted Ser/Thr protein kinase